MAQTNISVRMDEELKAEFDALCKSIGLTMSTAICVFAKKAVAEQRIPFELTAPKPKLDTSQRIGAGVGILPPMPKDFDTVFMEMDKEIEQAFEESGDLL